MSSAQTGSSGQGQQAAVGGQGQQAAGGGQGQQAAGGGQGQQAAGGGQQQQVAGRAGGGGATKMRGSKPPKDTEEGGFDLYHAQLEAILAENDCWDVVTGTNNVNQNDPQWIEKNRFARYALLFGMLPKDSKKFCKLTTAQEMWQSFERDKTKRAYSSIVRLRTLLYSIKYTSGEDMEKFLAKLEDMRRQLANMNAPIADGEMANIILQSVMKTHRDVVRIFDHYINGGANPDLDVVVNTLLGEAEIDRAYASEVQAASNQSETSTATKVMSQQPVEKKHKGKKKSGSGKKVSKENRSCFFCKKKGHLRADCYGWKALQKKKAEEERKGDKGQQTTKMDMIWSGELGDDDNPPVLFD